MKKFLPLLLTLCLLLSLFSCGARGDGEPSETPVDSGSGEQDAATEYVPTWHLSETLYNSEPFA